MKNKYLKILAPIALALGVTSCNGLGGLPSLPATPLCEASKFDEQALIVAESVFKGGSAALEAAVDSGVLRGTTAATAGIYYGQAKTHLDTARSAYKTCSSSSLLEASMQVQSLVTKIFGLVKK